MKIGLLVPEIQAVEGFENQYKANEFLPFVWLYLKINIC